MMSWNSKLVILDSYNSLVNCVDILAEQTLNSHSQSSLLIDFTKNKDKKMRIESSDEEDDEENENSPNIFEVLQAPFVDSFKADYQLDNKYKSARVDPKTTTVHEYVNEMRQEMIDELKRAQGETLEWFDAKSQLAQQPSLVENESNQDTDRHLFGDKYCFIVEKLGTSLKFPTTKTLFGVHLFFLDFYLTSRAQEILRKIMSTSSFLNCRIEKVSTRFLRNNADCDGKENHDLRNDTDENKLSHIDEDTILTYKIYTYVMQSINCDLAFGHHVFHVKLDQLNELNKCTLNFDQPPAITVDKNHSFPNLKALDIRSKLSNRFSPCVSSLYHKKPSNVGRFGGFSDLVSLRLEKATIQSFHDLPNLRHLEFKFCEFDKLSSDAFAALLNLESLVILHPLEETEISENFNLESLPNLQTVVLIGLGSFNIPKLPRIKHLKQKPGDFTHNPVKLNFHFKSTLESLTLNLSNVDEIEPFDLLGLSNLTYFELQGPYQRTINFHKSLKDLISPLNALEELHLVSLQLTNPMLTGAFAHMKSLKKLNVRRNKLKSIDSETFAGLENLNDLNVSDNCLMKISPQTFLDLFPKLERLVLSHLSSKKMENNFKKFFDSRFVSYSFV